MMQSSSAQFERPTTVPGTSGKSERRSPLRDIRKMPGSQEERANRYYALREENGVLKEKLQDYDQDIKKLASYNELGRMSTSLMKLETQVAQMRKKKTGGKGLGGNEDIDALIGENKELKERVRRTDAVLKAAPVRPSARSVRERSTTGRRS